jgi:4-aminobutyrate aminotransferase-like enzyme
MTSALHHPREDRSNTLRDDLARLEPRALRTFTPSQAILSRSAGIFHWTPEGRRLYDFTSGVLVANLGHNPTRWMQRFASYLGWKAEHLAGGKGDFFEASTLTAYNAGTPVEIEATRRLLKLLQSRPGGARLQQTLWSASGSEAIQKALWAGLARDRTRPMILATRFGFHGKKGLANAVTGSETDSERDPRVRFVSFPMAECLDVTNRDAAFDPTPYRRELDALYNQFGRQLGMLITEPYIGGGGSYHPPRAYLQLLQQFCRERDLIFILDEVQANFGRTGDLFAFETYGIEPDIVVLGKGLGNGVPVAAAVGRADLFASLQYGEGSDTWSANPLSCAAVLATLDEFEGADLLGPARRSSAIIEAGLVRLKELPFVAYVRGEKGGMVWGIEFKDWNGQSAADWANAFVLAAYRGEGSEGIHLLGALAKKVVRISPPLVITEEQARASVELLHRLAAPLVGRPKPELAGTR